MYKLDTHVHTKEISSCSRVEAREAVRLYKKAAYDGIVITDHYYQGYFETLPESSWEDKINCFLRGYKIAKEEGDKLGITVLLGIELRFTENPSDYLVFGITEEFLVRYPELYKLGVKNFRKLIEKEDILLFQAHPYRSTMVVADAQDLHGIEVYNGNPRQNSRNDKAYSLAKEKGLLMSSGSDFHQVEDLARGGMIFREVIKTSGELLRLLRENSALELISTI
ncbi:MAG: phosphoesterase [Lachnospiraceae bacterium]|jgi:predicted metal-dependent phosphoesterase TrpH|nr:phosphoesterase [Lachnospiraceae bacterium]